MYERNPSKLARRGAVIALSALIGLGSSVAVRAASGDAGLQRTGFYAGAFLGAGRANNRIVDVDGAANWGTPGWTVDYDDSGFIGGALIGRKFQTSAGRIRLELDGALGDLSAKTNKLDPGGLDETAKAKFRWTATLRTGGEWAVGAATVFATGGLAAARISNSVTDLDRSGLNDPWRFDPDDSFRQTSTEVGWTISVGVEAALSPAWSLRLEGNHLDFGSSTHHVNHSANDHCGPGNPQRPCPYKVKNKLGVIRLGISRRFGG